MTSREDLRRQGAAMRDRLGFPPNTADKELAPGLAQLSTEMVFGAVWSRPGLDLEDRMLATLAVLTSRQHLAHLGRYVDAALTIGLPARTIQEVFIHCGIYTGFLAVLDSLGTAKAVFDARGIEVPDADIPDPDAEQLMAIGVATMNALHGDRADKGYAKPANRTTAALYETAVAYGYGDIWSRPDLDHRQRMICTIAAFIALDLTPQVVKFGQSALNVGLSKDQLIEVIVQTSPYSGFPRALNALALLSEKLDADAET